MSELSRLPITVDLSPAPAEVAVVSTIRGGRVGYLAWHSMKKAL